MHTLQDYRDALVEATADLNATTDPETVEGIAALTSKMSLDCGNALWRAGLKKEGQEIASALRNVSNRAWEKLHSMQ